MERIKRADYYIEKVARYEYSDEDWLLLEKEIENWRKETSYEERIKFAESGAGEMLYMICSAIKIRRGKNAT